MSNECNWYLWLNLIKSRNRNEFVDNHLELRQMFSDFGKKYEHLQIHDGDFDKLPSQVIVLASYQHNSNRYAMARTTEQFKVELERLKEDLTHASLESRIIGPTNKQEDVIEYGDNFELQEAIKTLQRLRRQIK